MPPHSAHRDRPPDARARPCHHTRRTAIVPPDARARPCHHTRRIEGVPPDPRPRPCHHTRRTASVRRRAGATMLPHSANRDRAETRGRDHTTTLGKSQARISRKWLTNDRITANARTARASVAPRPGSRGRVWRHGRVRAGECGATVGFARASVAPRPGSRGRVRRHGRVRAGECGATAGFARASVAPRLGSRGRSDWKAVARRAIGTIEGRASATGPCSERSSPRNPTRPGGIPGGGSKNRGWQFHCEAQNGIGGAGMSWPVPGTRDRRGPEPRAMARRTWWIADPPWPIVAIRPAGRGGSRIRPGRS